MELIIGSFIAASLLVVGHLGALVEERVRQTRRRRF